MTITLVKKIKLDGSPCRKCAEVIERLETAGLMGRIDHTVIADERDLNSEGMRVAAELGVHQAPFFIVSEDGTQKVYTSYVKLLKEVLTATPSEADEAREIMENNMDLDVF